MLVKLWRPIAAAALTLVTGLPAGAQFVEYFTTNGDWSVTCARDMLSTQVTCSLSAPQVRLGQLPTAILTIAAPSGTSPVVSFRLPGVVDAAKTVSAAVDDAPAVASQANRYGEGRWEGVAAATLIKSMRVSNNLRLSWWLEGEMAPRTTTFALAGFAAALDDYRKRVAAYRAAP